MRMLKCELTNEVAGTSDNTALWTTEDIRRTLVLFTKTFLRFSYWTTHLERTESSHVSTISAIHTCFGAKWFGGHHERQSYTTFCVAGI